MTRTLQLQELSGGMTASPIISSATRTLSLAQPAPSPPRLSTPRAPPPLLSSLLSSLLSVLDFCSQLLVILTAAFLSLVRQQTAAALHPFSRTRIGRICAVLLEIALPLPMHRDMPFAPPVPFAGSQHPEIEEMDVTDDRGLPVADGLGLYQPVAPRRRRRYTVRKVAGSGQPSTVPLSAGASLPPLALPLLCLQLVLDLDETLVHTTDVAIPVYDCRVEIHTRRLSRTFFILKRPYLDTFLLTLSPYYHLIVFTASIRRYADAVIDLIDSASVIRQRFFRSHCLRDEASGELVKDLRVVGRGRKRMVIVDNSPAAYSRNEDNAVPIDTWYDEQSDTQLRELIPLLIALRNVDDVRSVLSRRRRMLLNGA